MHGLRVDCRLSPFALGIDEVSKLAPTIGKRLFENIEEAIDEAIGQTPDDVAVRLADQDAGEAHIGKSRNAVVHPSRLIVQCGKWEPERVLDLAGCEDERLLLLEMKGMGRDHELGTEDRKSTRLNSSH